MSQIAEAGGRQQVDRLVLVRLYRLAPKVLDALKILQPEAVVRWRRAGFRVYSHWKSRPRGKATDFPRTCVSPFSR